MPSSRNTALVIWSIVAGLFVGMPVFGVALVGLPIQRYLLFPPKTQFVLHAPFSWWVFCIYALIVAGTCLLMLSGLKRKGYRTPARAQPNPWPWWGWIGIVTLPAAWILAWTRFAWFRPLQTHTFAPLWLSFIVVINAFCYRRSGRCMMISETKRFVLLFPLSAAFWWIFEYLNRFVQNWYYQGVDFGPVAYAIYASLAFSTVLPAVFSMQRLIVSFAGFKRTFSSGYAFRIKRSKAWMWGTLMLSFIGLGLIGVFPNLLFPLVWVAPLLIVMATQEGLGGNRLFSDLAAGNWTYIMSFSLAALVCGFFWEMWNVCSFAKWKYSIPYVHRFCIFEMPLLGYAGYLPFGLVCALIGEGVNPKKWP